jgi:hypothetical protein
VTYYDEDEHPGRPDENFVGEELQMEGEPYQTDSHKQQIEALGGPSQQWMQKMGDLEDAVATGDVEPTRTCENCHQPYASDLVGCPVCHTVDEFKLKSLMESRRYSNQIETLNKAVNDLNVIVLDRGKRIAELERQLYYANVTLNKAVTDLNAIVLDRSKRIAELERQLYYANVSRKDAEQRIAELEDQVTAAGDGDTWREACKRCERELYSVRNELNAARQAESSTVTNQHNKIAELERLLETANMEAAVNGKGMECSKQVIEQLREQIAESKRLNVAYRDDYDRKMQVVVKDRYKERKRIDTLKSVLAKNEECLAITDDTLNKQRERIAELEHALGDKSKYVVRLEGLRDTDRERIEELEAI